MLSPSVMADSLRPHGLWTVGLLCTWDSPGPPPGDFPHPGIKLESLVPPTLQADSLSIWEAPDKRR